MANQEQIDLLKQGVDAWNQWCGKNPPVQIDLSGVDLNGAILRRAYFYNANLSGTRLSKTDLRGANLAEANLRSADLHESMLSEADLSGADLRGANLHKANLSQASLNGTAFRETNLNRASFKGAFLVRAHFSEVDFGEADFSQANLSGASFRNANLSKINLSGADLSQASLEGAILSKTDLRGAFLNNANLRETHFQQADLSKTNLQRANLSGADLSRANLSNADLLEADLQRANVSEANFTGANLSKCRIYAISAWNIRLENTIQSGLIITPEKEPIITVDDLEVAQFIYLLLNHQKLRNVLNAVTERGVLLLGRFGDGGLKTLQAVAARLREEQYLPIIFDFDRPQDRNYTETVKTLAGLSRFIIADLSGPSVPQELYATVPHFKIPFVPILESGREQFAMALDLLEYPWVVRPPVIFASTDELVSLVPSRIIAPAEEKHQARQQLLDELFNPT